jgi:hypothetical protein
MLNKHFFILRNIHRDVILKVYFDCMLSDSHRHVTEVTCDIGNTGSYSECTVLTVTVLELTPRDMTEVTYDIGNSGSYSECTVPTVTVLELTPRDM